MILGIGVDLVSISRIENLMLQFKERFIRRIFTANEILKANQIAVSEENFLPQAAFYAKRFAAKEAFSKAAGLGIGRGINFVDIEISNDDFGKPKIQLSQDKIEFLQAYFYCKEIAIHLSLSDEKTFANAFVIIEKIA